MSAESVRTEVGLTRLELVTSPLSGVRSNRLSYRPSGADIAVAPCFRPARAQFDAFSI